MISNTRSFLSVGCIILLFTTMSLPSEPVIADQQDILQADQYDKGFRYVNQGWVYVYLEGDPYERGLQHGRLLAPEIVEHITRWSRVIHNFRDEQILSRPLTSDQYNQTSELWWEFCRMRCGKWYMDKFPTEYLDEMQGITDGVNQQDYTIFNREITLLDIITVNEMYELLSKLEAMPKLFHPMRTFLHQIQQQVPEFWPQSTLSFLQAFFTHEPPHHCSGFIATGDATTHGQIVISDAVWCGPGSWWWNYYISLRWNIILDINPTTGYRFQMASAPGFIWSDHDYYQNEQGIAFIETTVPQGRFDNIGLPLSVRARTSVQYGKTIDDVVDGLQYQNDGSMNAVWLIGDIKTGEIARMDLGYRHSSVQRAFDGFFWSANNPEDLRVRLEKIELETLLKRFIMKVFFDAPGFGYHSFLYRPESRDIAFEELGNYYYGNIDVDIVKTIMASTPIGDWSTDCKISDTSLIQQNALWCFFGNQQGNILNMTIIDKPEKNITPIPPHGWTQIIGIPEKNNFTLSRNVKQFNCSNQPLWYKTLEPERNDFCLQIGSHQKDLYAIHPQGYIYQLNESNGIVNWEVYIGQKPSNPIITDKGIILGHSRGVTCVDHNGSFSWILEGFENCTSLAISDKKLFIAEKTGYVYSYDLSNETVTWAIHITNSIPYLSTSSEELLVSIGSTLYCLDKESGLQLWTFETKGLLFSPPEVYNDLVYIAGSDTYLYALDRDNGSLVWSYELGWGASSTPVVLNDQLFIGSHDHNLYSLDAQTGALQWLFSTQASIQASPCVTQDVVITGSDDGQIYAITRSSGDTIWKYTPQYSVDEDTENYQTTPLITSPFILEDLVFISAAGRIYSLPLSC